MNRTNISILFFTILFFSFGARAMEEVIEIEEPLPKNPLAKHFKNVKFSAGERTGSASISTFYAVGEQLLEPKCEDNVGIFYPDEKPEFQEVGYSQDWFSKVMQIQSFELKKRRQKLEEERLNLGLRTEKQRQEKDLAKKLKEQKREKKKLEREQLAQQKEEGKAKAFQEKLEQQKKDGQAWHKENKRLFWRGIGRFAATTSLAVVANKLLTKTKYGAVVCEAVEPLGFGPWIKGLFVPVVGTWSFGRYGARKAKGVFSKEGIKPVIQEVKNEIEPIVDETVGKAKKELKEVYADVEIFAGDLLAKVMPLVLGEVKLLKDEVLVDVDILAKQQLLNVEGSINNITDNLLENKVPRAVGQINKGLEDILCEKNMKILDLRMKQAGSSAQKHLVPVVQELSKELVPAIGKGAVSIPGRVLGWALGWNDGSAAQQTMEGVVNSGAYSNAFPGGFPGQ